MKKLLLVLSLVLTVGLVGCSDADVVSSNLSKEAEQFRIQRRIVFINGITDNYMFEIVGNCSIEADMEDEHLEVTCKIGEDAYQKHYLGLSDNVTYIVEHIGTTKVSAYHYEIIFKPDVIVPHFEVVTEIGQ